MNGDKKTPNAYTLAGVNQHDDFCLPPNFELAWKRVLKASLSPRRASTLIQSFCSFYGQTARRDNWVAHEVEGLLDLLDETSV